LSSDHPSCAEIAETVGLASWNEHSAGLRADDVRNITATLADVHHFCHVTIDGRDVVITCRDPESPWRVTTIAIGTDDDPWPFMNRLVDRTPFLTDVLTGCITILERLGTRIDGIEDGTRVVDEEVGRRMRMLADVTDALGDAAFRKNVLIGAATPFVPAVAKGTCFDSIGRRMADMRDRLLPLVEPLVRVSFHRATSDSPPTVRFDRCLSNARQDHDGMEMLRIHQRIDAMLKGRS
jgi:hypothetical protein